MEGGDQTDQDVRDDGSLRARHGLSWSERAQRGGGGSVARVRGLRRATATPTSASPPPT